MPQCSVPLCTKRDGHKFPIDIKRRKLWVLAIKRNDSSKLGKAWTPCKAARVCTDHFDSSDYLQLNYYGNTPGKKQLKKIAVPHIFKCWSKVDTTHVHSGRHSRAQKRQVKSELIETVHAIPDIGTEIDVETDMLVDRNNNAIPESTTYVSVGTQTGGCQAIELGNDEKFSDAQVKEPTTYVSVGTQTMGCQANQLYSAKNFSDANIHHYTGLENYMKFQMVLHSLGPAAYDLNYYYKVAPPITVEDQFFLTLIKLRTHPCNKELCIYFGLNEKQVSNIFITWVNFMYLQWSEIDWWPCRELVKYYAPSDFFSKFPNTRCIVDGTECPIMSPKQPIAQQATFSTYKNRNTVKCLIGSSPGGLVTFVSKAYAGSTSDRQIVERSSLPQTCDPGDEVMADKGFNVDDLFLPYHVSINIPTFFRKKNRMSSETVLRDRKISSKRVHIERIIGLGKTYKILKQPMTHIESSLSSRIIFIVYTLCNFRKCIVPRNA